MTNMTYKVKSFFHGPESRRENVGHVSHLDMTISIAHYTGAVYPYSTYKFFIYNPNKMTT